MNVDMFGVKISNELMTIVSAKRCLGSSAFSEEGKLKIDALYNLASEIVFADTEEELLEHIVKDKQKYTDDGTYRFMVGYVRSNYPDIRVPEGI